MYCPHCGKETSADAVVCTGCGRALQALSGYQARTTNGKAIASMILGLLWLWGVGSIIALVLGYASRRQIAESNGSQEGSGLAVAGIVLGWVGVAGTLLFIVRLCTAVDSLTYT